MPVTMNNHRCTRCGYREYRHGPAVLVPPMPGAATYPSWRGLRGIHTKHPATRYQDLEVCSQFHPPS